jgi:hypothetical protein
MLQLPTIRTLVSSISCGSIDITSLLSFPLPLQYLGYRLQYSIQVLDGTGGFKILFISANILNKKLWSVKNSVVFQNWVEELVIPHHKTTH